MQFGPWNMFWKFSEIQMHPKRIALSNELLICDEKSPFFSISIFDEHRFFFNSRYNGQNASTGGPCRFQNQSKNSVKLHSECA